MLPNPNSDAAGPAAEPSLDPGEPIIEPVRTDLPGYVAGPAPVPVGRAPRRLGGLLVGVAIALVAVLGGSGLFLSGYSLGAHQANQPGTSANDDAAFQPFWDAYHNVISKFALGPVDKTKVIEGAIKGMVDSLGDPFSAYLLARGLRQHPVGHLRPVRGHRCRDRHGRWDRQAGRLLHVRAQLSPRDRPAAAGLAGRAGRAQDR